MSILEGDAKGEASDDLILVILTPPGDWGFVCTILTCYWPTNKLAVSPRDVIFVFNYLDATAGVYKF